MKQQPARTLNYSDYFDRVLGAWTGKSLGGIVGAPFEGEVPEAEEIGYRAGGYAVIGLSWREPCAADEVEGKVLFEECGAG